MKHSPNRTISVIGHCKTDPHYPIGSHDGLLESWIIALQRYRKRYIHNLSTSRLCVGAAACRWSEQTWNYFSVVVQWFTFPTSHHVTRLDNVGRFYSDLTEIVGFGECFIFVPTCLDSLESRVWTQNKVFFDDPRIPGLGASEVLNLWKPAFVFIISDTYSSNRLSNRSALFSTFIAIGKLPMCGTKIFILDWHVRSPYFIVRAVRTDPDSPDGGLTNLSLVKVKSKMGSRTFQTTKINACWGKIILVQKLKIVTNFIFIVINQSTCWHPNTHYRYSLAPSKSVRPIKRNL